MDNSTDRNKGVRIGSRRKFNEQNWGSQDRLMQKTEISESGSAHVKNSTDRNKWVAVNYMYGRINDGCTTNVFLCMGMDIVFYFKATQYNRNKRVRIRSCLELNGQKWGSQDRLMQKTEISESGSAHVENSTDRSKWVAVHYMYGKRINGGCTTNVFVCMDMDGRSTDCGSRRHLHISSLIEGVQFTTNRVYLLF